MKKLSFTLMVATSMAFTTLAAYGQEGPVAGEKAMKPLSCSIDLFGGPGKSSTFTVALNDHKPTGEDPNELWKRVPIKAWPGYYLQVWSTPGPFGAEQHIDLRIKLKKQLGTYDEYAVGTGYGEASLSVSPVGEKKTKISVHCTSFY